MRIAIEGCAHGELEVIYNTISEIEKSQNIKIDLLICCGDFQSTRNTADLACMAVPDKYKEMCTFYKYYSGEKVAPVLTIFIGGNHEASNYLQELPYGGWVAPNIYYMGYAGVVKFGGIRIAGLSGIYKSQHILQGHFEQPPYNASTIRSVYHTRNLEIFRLKQLSGHIDIFLSHDWPCGVTKYGDEKGLLRRKPFFKEDIQTNSLGSPPCMELLEQHYPSYWFSAHLHCKFAALIPKQGTDMATKFLALDKCLPKRQFLQVLEIPHDEDNLLELTYDLEWLTILYLTNHLLNVKSNVQYMPGQGGIGRWNFIPTELEKENVLKRFKNELIIPSNFAITVPPFNPESPHKLTQVPSNCINNQTTSLCDKLGIDDPLALIQIMNGSYREDKSSINDSFNESCSQDSQSTSEPNELSSMFEDDSILAESLNDSVLQSSEKMTLNSTVEMNELEDEEPKSTPVEPNLKKLKRRT